VIAWSAINYKGMNKLKIKIQNTCFLYLDQAEANRASVMILVELDGYCDDLPVYVQQQQKPGSPVNPKRPNTAGRQLRSGGSSGPLFTQATRHATEGGTS